MNAIEPETPPWFLEFIKRHVNRCHAARWPALVAGKPTQEWIDMFRPWLARFVREGITQEIADRASNDVAEHAYPAPGGKHLDEFMVKANRIKAALSAQGPLPTSWDDARRRAKGCPECCANGWTTRRRFFDRLPEGQSVPVAIFCLCPAGEWLAQSYFHSDRDLFNQTRRLVQYPELWDNRLSHPSWPEYPVPRDWTIELLWDRRVDRLAEVEGITTPADLRAMVHGIGRNVSSEKVRVL